MSVITEAPVQETITVLDPTARAAIINADAGPDVGPVATKTIAFRVDDLWPCWNWIVDEWSKPLIEGGAKIVSWRRENGISGAEGLRRQREYEALVASADVVISGLGNCGSCTAHTVQDALSGRALGIAAMAVTTKHFAPLAQAIAENSPWPGLRLFELPYPLHTRPEAEVREIARELLPSAFAGLGIEV